MPDSAVAAIQDDVLRSFTEQHPKFSGRFASGTNLKPIISTFFRALGEVFARVPLFGLGYHRPKPFNYPDTLAGLSGFPETGMPRKSFLELFALRARSMASAAKADSLYNIIPTVDLRALAAATAVQIANPNMAVDLLTGGWTLAEQHLVRAIADVVFGHTKVGGMAVSSGKETAWVAIQHGLKNCMPGYSEYGIREPGIVIISDRAHDYTLERTCEQLGLGNKALVKIPVNADGSMHLPTFERVMREAIANGEKIACVIATSGTTIDLAIDDCAEIRRISETVQKDFGLSYRPYIHADAVMGFMWLIANEKYLKAGEAKDRILEAQRRLRGIASADSFGADPHKMWPVPYGASLFVTARPEFLNAVPGDSGYYHPRDGASFSRSPAAVAGMYCIMHEYGIDGLTHLLEHHMEAGLAFRKQAEAWKMPPANNGSLGFECILALSWPDGTPYTEKEYAGLVEKRFWFDEDGDGELLPLISYNKGRGILIYPNSLELTGGMVNEILYKIHTQKQSFEKTGAVCGLGGNVCG